MDFDECDYLEKTIEDGGNQSGVSKKNDGAAEKSGRSYRKRDGSVNGVDDVAHDDVDVNLRKHKRSRAADDDDRERSEKDRHRSGRDKDRDEVRRERDGEKDGRRRERDGDKELERERRRVKDRDRDLDRERRHGRRRERDDDKEFEGEKRKENDGGKELEREKDVERDRKDSGRRERNDDNDLERDRKNNERKDGDDDKEVVRDRKDSGRREKAGDGDKSRERRSREKDRGREREKDGEREKEKERLGDGEKEKGRGDREKREQEKSVEKKREREKDERSQRSRSRSMSRRHEVDLDREREFEPRESRRLKEKKEAVEPEVDPERDQRTVFAYQMPLKANERDVYDFFSKAGKVRDVRLIMDRNSRRSKGVGYIEFYDAMYVPMAIALSGHLLHGQPVMVKPSEAEKNLVQSTAAGGVTSGVTGPYGPVDRKLYVGNLHFNMTELQLRQIFEPFGAVELVQLPLDLETGHCKGFGFIQFTQVEHAKAAQSLNGKLEIAGRVIKVSCVTDHVGVHDTGVKSADFDDDDGGGLALNAHSRALLMQKLDRTGVASSITGAFGNTMLNGAAQSQLPFSMSGNGQVVLPGPPVPAQVFAPPASESVGNPSECLLLKNMFDPASEAVPDFDLAIKEEVEEECSNFGRVMHIHVEKNSAGFVYLRFETVEAALKAQQTMHMRWYACRLISALFMQPFEYEAKFNAGS